MTEFNSSTTHGQDTNELLLFSLRKLFQEAASLAAVRRQVDDPDQSIRLEVEVEDFEAR